MSLDSTLWIATRATPMQVSARLTATSHFEPLPGRDRPTLTADGTIVTIAKPTIADIAREHGVDATLSLFFACTDSEHTGPWTLNTVRATLALLHGFPGDDMLLVYSSDYPALLRKGGGVVLDSNAGLWKADVEPQVLPLIDLAYTFEALPVL